MRCTAAPAEAAGLRGYATGLLAELPGAAGVVAGDLYDDHQAATTQLCTDQSPVGSEVDIVAI